MDYNNLNERVAIAIINKKASIKAISKELIKLSAMLGDIRMSTALSLVDKMATKEASRSEEDSHDEIKNAKGKEIIRQLQLDHCLWAMTPSKNMVIDGTLVDECTLNYPIEYFEVSNKEFEKIKKAALAVTDPYLKYILVYQNTLFTAPTLPKSALYNLVKGFLKL